jgi:hypothetical protein
VTVTAPTFTLEDVATRWSTPRVDVHEIVAWMVDVGYIVAVDIDTFVVTDEGIDVSELLNDSAREWFEVVRA